MSPLTTCAVAVITNAVGGAAVGATIVDMFVRWSAAATGVAAVGTRVVAAVTATTACVVVVGFCVDAGVVAGVAVERCPVGG